MTVGQEPVESRVATRGDVWTVSETLARAFDEDPLMRWLARSDAVRAHGLRHLFALNVATMGIDGGHTRLLADGSGAAMWTPPGHWRAIPPIRGLVRVPHVIVGLFRGLRTSRLRAMEPMLRAHPKTPHWYLFAVGVVPERQGQGLGAGLLRETLVHIDTKGEAAYLENSNPRNTRLYERLGFEVTGRFRPGPDGPELLLMWRPPQAAGRR